MHNVITLLRNEKIYQEADMGRVQEQDYLVSGFNTSHIDSANKYKQKRIQDKLCFIADLDKAIMILTTSQEAL